MHQVLKDIPKKTLLLSLFLIVILSAVILLPAAAVGHQFTVVINEVVSGSSRPPSGTGTGTPDWIELYNPSNEDIDLTGYRLTDKVGSAGLMLDGVSIPAGGYFLIYASKNDAVKDSDACYADFGISSSGETLYLIGHNNSTVCRLAVPALPDDVSYARRSDGTYGYCADVTPGEKNADNIVSADELGGMIKTGSVIISEILPESGDGFGWVELYNAGDTEVSLGSYWLSDSMGDMGWHLPARTLAAKEYAVVYLSGASEASPEMHAPFKIGNQDFGIYLHDYQGKLVSSLTWNAPMPCGISVVWDNAYTALPTRGSANSKETFPSVVRSAMDETNPVRISEVLADNEYSIADGNGERSEWAEIHNKSGNAVSLAGYYLSDDEDDLFKWAFPDIKIEPDGYMVVFLSGKESRGDELHAGFSLSKGEGIYLTNINGMRVDSLLMSGEIRANVSAGRGDNEETLYYAQPTPGGENAKGFSSPEEIGFFDAGGIYISEVCAANKPKSGLSDWIEIHNGSDAAAQLEGYYLSDDADKPDKWRIPALEISPGGYAVIKASSLGGTGLTANFSISPSGETVYLSDPQKRIIDAFDTGVLACGITSGRAEGNSELERVFFKKPTPGAPNDTEYLSGCAQMPVFSRTGLYNTEAFPLEITCSTPGARIYYTTDGSVPNEGSKRYEGPIVISENTPVRAIAFADGLLPSEVNTATYLFGDPHTLPVFCICGDPSELKKVLDIDKLYKPEYAAYAEYYEADGTMGVSFPAGIRPKGKASLGLPQNSLCLSLRSNYGRKSVSYPFFPDSDITEYTTLTLRSGGQDSVFTKLRDSFFQKISAGMNVDSICNRTVVAYINGQYCGLYELNEEQNDGYIESHYGVKQNNLDMISRSKTVVEGDANEYRKICRIARQWRLSDDKVFEEFAKLVDVDACTDYLIAQIYFGNGDVVNHRFWRARDYSVKWRPLLFDLDFCLRFNDKNRNVFRKYLTPNPWIGGYFEDGGRMTAEMYIFCGLQKNASWREKFVERFVEISVTQYDTQRILKIFDEMVKTMEPEMERHIKRWHTPRSMDYWRSEVAKLRSAIEQRQQIALKQLQNYFRVSDKTIQDYIKIYSQS